LRSASQRQDHDGRGVEEEAAGDRAIARTLHPQRGRHLPRSHQSIGQVYGGKVIRAPEPLHGKLSTIRHFNTSVFKGLPERFQVTRYHSLIVERKSLPDCLEVTAETDDGIIMGLMHKTHPVHGVQFHPESIASEQGHALLANFLTLAGMTPKRRAATQRPAA
jgi:anthranilate synthase component 2